MSNGEMAVTVVKIQETCYFECLSTIRNEINLNVDSFLRFLSVKMKLDHDLCAHYLNLDFSKQFLNDNEANISIEFPYPLNKPFTSENVDIIETYNEKLKTYYSQLAVLDKEFHLVRDEVLKQNFSNSHVTITQGLLDLCHSEKYEVPFLCDYNPFYASGLLQHFHTNNQDYLVRPDYKNNLRITNIRNPRKTAKLKLASSLVEPITGISVYENGGIFLLVRHGDNANLIRISDVKQPVDLKWTKKFKHSLIDSKCSKSQLGVILSNSKFQLYDLETTTKINLDKYGQNVGINFEFIDCNKISVVSQKDLRILDQRCGDCKLLTPDLNPCDYLCSAKIDDNWVYMGTRHFLLRTDVRFEKSIELCTHLMKYTPCYMDICDSFLCLSSQNAKEKVLFSGNPVGSLPLNVPNIFETLHHCKLQKDILLKNEVDQRLEKSVAGVKLIRDDNDVFLYSVNCLGDIFKQKITTRSSFDDDSDSSIDNLFSWIKKLPEGSKRLHLTNAANMSDALFILNKRIEEEHLHKFTTQSKKASRFLNHFNNFYRKENLSELARNFTSIWDQEEEEEAKEDMHLVPEVAPLDKVNSWIQSNFSFD